MRLSIVEQIPFEIRILNLEYQQEYHPVVVKGGDVHRKLY
jgi:hypothetical protein